MYLFLIIVALVIVIGALWGTYKALKKHIYYRRISFSFGSSKTFLVLTVLMFALGCVWHMAMDTIDSMRSPDFWMPIFSQEEILSEVFEAASDYNIDLGIPTSEVTQDMALMFYNVELSFTSTLWCAIAALLFYIMYVFGIFKLNKILLYISLILQAGTFIIAARAAATGAIQMVNWITSSNLWNPYTGDMRDSVMLPFFTAVACIVAGILLFRAIYSINRMFTQIGNITNEGIKAQDIQKEQNRTNDTLKNIELLTEFNKLKDEGVITEEEFINVKNNILN